MSLLLALFILAAPTATVFAQDTGDEPVVFCGDLSEEDCSMLAESAVMMADLTEASYTAYAEFDVSGIPEAPFDEITGDITETGSYIVDEALQEELKSMKPDDYMAAMEDKDALQELVLSMVDGMDTVQDIQINLNEELAGLLSAQIEYPIPESMHLRFVITDGEGYINLDDLSAMIPEMGEMSGWIGTELDPILEYVFSQMEMDTSAGDLAPAGQAMAMVSPEGQMEIFGDYMNISRVDDTEIDGEDAAVFVTVIDFAGFLTSPEFLQFVVDQLAASGEAAISESDLAQIQMFMPMIGPMLAGGLNAGSAKYISLDSGYTLLGESVFEWDMSSIMSMLSMTGAVPAPPAGARTFIGFNTSTAHSDFNDVGEISAPENAMFVPGDQVVEMMKSSQ
jgi:hypothetical protein